MKRSKNSVTSRDTLRLFETVTNEGEQNLCNVKEYDIT